MPAPGWDDLQALAAQVAAPLRAKGQTLAVAESSSGGLLSAALLSVPGASAYYLGGGVIYTPRARHRLLGLRRADVAGVRSASEDYARLLAATVRRRFTASWGLSETGATGPTGNPYGDPAGHSWVAVAGLADTAAQRVETGSADRPANMLEFAAAALRLLAVQLDA